MSEFVNHLKIERHSLIYLLQNNTIMGHLRT